MKKSKWADWLVVIGFLGFLALALAVTLVRPKSGWSYYENRNLARPAELSVETVLDGTFPASVEPVLQDPSPPAWSRCFRTTPPGGTP